jgi:UvrD/REP helicase N-terminal domain
MFASVIAASAVNLNDEQRRAATHPTGTLLILAGAGTGKRPRSAPASPG